MDSVREVKALLITNSEGTAAHLRESLERLGCECWIGRSMEESRSLCERHSFHLVLSSLWLSSDEALLETLIASRSTVFFSYSVSEGCWWLPVARGGEKCLGAAGLRSREFRKALHRAFREA
jgi:hypothetical protein